MGRSRLPADKRYGKCTGGGIDIHINPGSVFGTSHPTTQLCLKAVERHCKPGATMIDLGTGTGILAIAAAKMDAAQVLAVDIDPEAVRIARENAATNGVAEKISVELGSLGEILSGNLGIHHASLVVANILSHVLVGFFEQGLAQIVSPGGILVLSGILRTQTPEMRACLQRHEMKQLAQEQLEDWVCVIATGKKD